MTQRTYPCVAWRLSRNFQILRVELVAGGIHGSGYDRTSTGHSYPLGELFASRLR